MRKWSLKVQVTILRGPEVQRKRWGHWCQKNLQDWQKTRLRSHFHNLAQFLLGLSLRPKFCHAKKSGKASFSHIYSHCWAEPSTCLSFLRQGQSSVPENAWQWSHRCSTVGALLRHTCSSEQQGVSHLQSPADAAQRRSAVQRPSIHSSDGFWGKQSTHTPPCLHDYPWVDDVYINQNSLMKLNSAPLNTSWTCPLLCPTDHHPDPLVSAWPWRRYHLSLHRITYTIPCRIWTDRLIVYQFHSSFFLNTQLNYHCQASLGFGVDMECFWLVKRAWKWYILLPCLAY